VWAVHADEIQTTRRSAGAYGYVIAAKRENAEDPAVLSGITAASPTAVVVGENRTVPIVGGTITDTFAPNAVHVYRYLAAPPWLAPRIHNLQILPRSDTSVRVTWLTDEPSDTYVKWGSGVMYTSEVQAETGYRVRHEAVLAGLVPWTRTYHLRARSSAGEGIVGYGDDVRFVCRPRPGDARLMRPDELDGTGALIGVAWMRVEGADGYRVYRRPHGTGGWSLLDDVAQVDGVSEIAHPDPGAVPQQSYDYRVTAYHGLTESAPSVWVEGMAGGYLTAAPEPEADTAPAALTLAPAAPNPFNPHTSLRFTLPESGPVRLTVHDAAGRLVASLVNASLAAGEHAVSWDGTDDGGAAVASGVYFARLHFGSETTGRKLVLQR